MNAMFRTIGASWRIATLVALCLSLAAAATTATAAANRVAPCNGASALCSRSFDQVTLPGSHNAMSNAEQNWNMPNQTFTIPDQLERGARAMLIDVHYGRKTALGVADVSEANYNPAAGDRLFLCHVSCGMGASDLVEVFGQIRDFLKANPREVLLFDVEDDVKPEDFEQAVGEGGLDGFLYRGPTTESDGWPTLGAMIRENQRVVFLHESGRTSAAWYPPAYGGTLQETPYAWPRPAPNNPDNFTGVQFLTDPAALASSCVANRGGTTGPLFLMNHWVSGDGIPGSSNDTVPQIGLADVVNSRAALVARARACETERGLRPTILAVDFFGAGDVVGAARELNGVTASAYFEFRRRPQRATVRAGRKAVFRMRLVNLGDAGGKAKVCANPPKRLAIRPRCGTLKVAPGRIGTAVIRVKTRGRSRGRGQVRFTVHAPGGKLKAGASLRVKPKPTRRRHRR